MTVEKVRFKKLSENAVVPSYGTAYSAGADLYSAMQEDVIIAPETTNWNRDSRRSCGFNICEKWYGM